MKQLCRRVALCALILVNALLATASAGPADPAKVQFRWDVKIPMRDGMHLAAIAYTPKNQPQPAPCIFTFTPYAAQTFHDRGVYFAAHGYAFLTIDVRGRGNSDGEFQPMIQEAHDGYDIVEWLAKQPYCNGKVAMWGGSYSGYNQWATAKEFPPHLGTIVPAAAPYAGVDFPMRNNIFAPYDVQWLTYTSGRGAQDRIFGDGSFWSAQSRDWYEAGRALSEFDTQVGNPSSIFQEWLAHPHQDAFWDRYNPTADQYARLNIPMLTITGSYDANQYGALTHYREHMKRASPEARAAHYLIIGPWDHSGTRTPKAEFGGLTLGPASLLDLPQLHLDWYAWTLQGGPKPSFLRKNVAYYAMGAEEWRYADSLDEVTAEQRPYYLASNDSAGDVLSSGSLTTAPRGGPDRYQYDPRDRRTAELESMPAPELTDQRLIYAQSGKQLVYHSAPFARPTEISGFFKFSAWLAIDQPDTDFAVSAYEIKPDGSSILLSTESLRARYRESPQRPKLIRTREPLRYDFDRFAFVSRQVEKGSRLRLVIAPLDSMSWQKNYNSGGDVAKEAIADARTVTVSLYHDRAHPSALYVPIGRSNASDAFVDWAKAHVVSLRDFPSNAASAAKMANIIGTSRMVALGEPAHGAHEPLAFRNELFKYLVERQGFTAIALESGLSESRRVNEYVLHGVGDAAEVARTSLTWGFGSYAENIELLQWMRQFNTDPAQRKKVRFYGIDLTGGDGDGQFATARIALNDALSYLARVDPERSSFARQALEPFLDRFTRDGYKSLSADARQKLRAAIDALISLSDHEHQRLVTASTVDDYEWARRNAVVALQLEELFRHMPADMPNDAVTADFQDAAASRDESMADNAQWVLHREGPSGRVLLFAHNAHVMNAPLRGGIWNVYSDPPSPMGQHLRSALKNDLTIIGTSAATNGPGLPPASLETPTMDAALTRIGPPTFILDLRDTQCSGSSAWLQELQSLRANFTTEIRVRPQQAFDAVVSLDHLSAAAAASLLD